MFTARPASVMRLGASQSGHRPTSQFHQGCMYGSRMLSLWQLYLCWSRFCSCAGDSSRSRPNSMVAVSEEPWPLQTGSDQLLECAERQPEVRRSVLMNSGGFVFAFADEPL